MTASDQDAIRRQWREAAALNRSKAKAIREEQVDLLADALAAGLGVVEIADHLELPCAEVVHLAQLGADGRGWTPGRR